MCITKREKTFDEKYLFVDYKKYKNKLLLFSIKKYIFNIKFFIRIINHFKRDINEKYIYCNNYYSF